MNKLIVLFLLMLAAAIPCEAEKTEVPMQFHKKDNTHANTHIDRAPARLPIQVFYDNVLCVVEVIGSDTIVAKDYLYDMSGALVDYSDVLNATLLPTSSGLHILCIQGDGWTANGKIEF